MFHRPAAPARSLRMRGSTRRIETTGIAATTAPQPRSSRPGLLTSESGPGPLGRFVASRSARASDQDRFGSAARSASISSIPCSIAAAARRTLRAALSSACCPINSVVSIGSPNQYYCCLGRGTGVSPTPRTSAGLSCAEQLLGEELDRCQQGSVVEHDVTPCSAPTGSERHNRTAVELPSARTPADFSTPACSACSAC